MKWTEALTETNNLTLPLPILPFDTKTVRGTFLLDKLSEIRGQRIIVGRYQRGGRFSVLL